MDISENEVLAQALLPVAIAILLGWEFASKECQSPLN